MINNDRIVSITECDLLSMYGLILSQVSANSAMTAIKADTVDGKFSCGTGIHLADQPVKSCDFTGASATLYFIADFAYEGFTKSGAAVTVSGDEVVADSKTLYKAVLASNAVTVTKVGF